jgi:hypothetical protein
MDEDVKYIYLLMLTKSDKIYKGDGNRSIASYCQSCVNNILIYKHTFYIPGAK